jgi:hypothetical protein
MTLDNISMELDGMERVWRSSGALLIRLWVKVPGRSVRVLALRAELLVSGRGGGRLDRLRR